MGEPCKAAAGTGRVRHDRSQRASAPVTWREKTEASAGIGKSSAVRPMITTPAVRGWIPVWRPACRPIAAAGARCAPWRRNRLVDACHVGEPGEETEHEHAICAGTVTLDHGLWSASRKGGHVGEVWTGVSSIRHRHVEGPGGRLARWSIGASWSAAAIARDDRPTRDQAATDRTWTPRREHRQSHTA
jgi:hypothetical protein